MCHEGERQDYRNKMNERFQASTAK